MFAISKARKISGLAAVTVASFLPAFCFMTQIEQPMRALPKALSFTDWKATAFFFGPPVASMLGGWVARDTLAGYMGTTQALRDDFKNTASLCVFSGTMFGVSTSMIVDTATRPGGIMTTMLLGVLLLRGLYQNRHPRP
jgi:hypothetical protein